MKTRKRDFGALFAAIVTMFTGLQTLHYGDVNYFGVTGFGGGQAQLFAWSAIAFSLVLFFVYFRGSSQS